jgi:2-keto-3-deoxy-L-rhamnonate aldolase RhmA
MINSIRERILNRELLTGTFLSLGNSITTEIAGNSGFDWLLLDVEHGSGSHSHLIHQIQATGATPAAPFVRIEDNQTARFKRVLDLGASGIMIPYVRSVEDAEQAVSAMRYPPRGIRGVAKLSRGSGFGANFEEYFEKGHEQLTTVIQIETAEALKDIDRIAAVDGVDVLFVGPMDLTVNMGIREQFDHPDYVSARKNISEAAKNAGKAAGILLQNTDQIPDAIEQGYTFVAIGSDIALVNAGMRQLSSAFDTYRK